MTVPSLERGVLMNIYEMKEGERGVIKSLKGTPEFQRRITAVGLTPDCHFEIIQNTKKYPVLIDVRNTILAINRKDCENIITEVLP